MYARGLLCGGEDATEDPRSRLRRSEQRLKDPSGSPYVARIVKNPFMRVVVCPVQTYCQRPDLAKLTIRSVSAFDFSSGVAFPEMVKPCSRCPLLTMWKMIFVFAALTEWSA